MSKGSNTTRSGSSSTTASRAVVNGGGNSNIAPNIAERLRKNADKLAWTKNVSDAELRRGVSANLPNGDKLTVYLRYEGRKRDKGYVETYYKNARTGREENISSSFFDSGKSVFGQTKEEALEAEREYIRDNILNRLDRL